jgi:hypothetical protein
LNNHYYKKRRMAKGPEIVKKQKETAVAKANK